MKAIPLTVYVSRELHDKFHTVAKEHGNSPTSSLRHMIRLFLKTPHELLTTEKITTDPVFIATRLLTQQKEDFFALCKEHGVQPSAQLRHLLNLYVRYPEKYVPPIKRSMTLLEAEEDVFQNKSLRDK